MATIDFIIQKAGGGTINLYNKNSATLSTITNAEQSQGLNSDDLVRITVESAVKIAFEIGDKINILGRWYKINRLPSVKKTGNRLFSYTIELEGVQYDLARAAYDLTIDTTNNVLQDVQADMLTGNLERFARVLISNANRVFPGKWILGEFLAGTEDKTLAFGETDNCLLVLQRLCTEYNTEFDITQAGDVNTINFRKAGQIFPYTFEYGKGKGLYSLERLNVSTANIVTRLKVYGGSRNITTKYRSARLCLPGKTKGQSFIEKADPVNKYGVWEATKYFDHIYPKRTGIVTAVSESDVLKLTDTTMNFDLNEMEVDGITTKYLIEGVTAKIHFNTGNLSGYEFEIQEYDHATKTFTLKSFEDERGERFPSSKSTAFQFGVNDEYVILDIALPQEYEDSSEAELQAEGDTFYDQNSQPKVQYSLEVSEDFLKELSGEGSITNIFSVGDYIPVKDTDIDVDKSVRIQSFTRDLLNPFSYKLNISDTVTTSITNKVISELIDIDNVTKINDIKNQIKARRDWRSAQELLGMIFDVEGNYYTEKIKPNSIETQMLSVGAKSTQFGLVGTVIQANYNGNKNSVNVKGGVLSHYTIAENGRDWNLANNTTTLTGDATPYYIYAKCQKVGTSGSIIFSTQKITVEQDPLFYHFFVGIVNSVDPELNVRSVALTYGFTTVNGKFIRTGRIQSNDGNTYFDLDTGVIGGKITFRSTAGTDEDLAEILDGTAQDIEDAQATANAAALKAQQAINEAEANVGLINTEVGKLQAQIDGEISNYYQPYKPTLANYPASEWTTTIEKDRHIGDLFLNIQAYVDDITTPDAGKAWRFIKDGTTYLWTPIADSDTVKAMKLAAQAQSTADGKSTTFLITPSNYKLGDMWVLNADLTVNGTAYKQGEILTATQDSTTYNQAHWVKKVRYTDDSAVNNIRGGVNLLLQSDSYDKTSITSNNNSQYPISKTNMDEGSRKFVRIKRTNTTLSPTIINLYNTIPLTALSQSVVGKEITISFDARVNLETSSTLYAVEYTPAKSLSDYGKTINLTTEWTRYYTTFVVSSDLTGGFRFSPLVIQIAGDINDFYLDISRFAVKFGNIKDEWDIAPEDIDAKIADTKLYVEYSTDGTSWHTTFQTNDIYMRQKTGVNGTWTGAIKIVGKDGTSVSIKGKVPTSASLPSSASLGDGYIAEDTGHLWVWTGSWTDAGQIQGDNGANSYIHIAYADDSLGGGFSHNPSGKSWIGIYADFTAIDSDTPSDYTWMYAKGQQGDQGVSVTGVDVEFAKNTSPTTAPTTGWTTTAPTLLDGEQLWTRTKTAYSSGNPTYSTPANITPKKGDTGAVGQGVESVTEEYAISTSKTTQPTTGWSTTQPTWSQGQYIWSRVKVVYKNPTSTVYTGYAVSSEWEAVNNLEIGGRNLLRNSSIPVTNSAYPIKSYTMSEKMVVGETYTIRIWGELGVGKTAFAAYLNGGSISLRHLSNNGDGTYSATFEGKDSGVITGDFINIYPLPNTTVVASTITKIKLEKGNKATDWTPAPEDVEASIETAKTEAENARNEVNSLNTYVTGAFKDGVIDEAEAKAIEKYKNTINETMAKAEASFLKVFGNTYLEGAAKIALENAKINLWGQRDTLLSTINTAIADGKTTVAEKSAVDSAFNTFNSLMSAFQNALEEANKAIQTKLDAIAKGYVDGLQIGGVNLLLNSALFAMEANNTGNGTSLLITNETEKFYRATPDAEKNVSLFGFVFQTINAQQYIQSCYVRQNSGSVKNVNIYRTGSSSNGLKTIQIQSGVWTYISTGIIVGNGSNGHLILQISGTDGVGVPLDYKKAQLEVGNKPTAWTPAPEDVQSAIDTEKARINDMLSDNIADPAEKQYLQNLWNEIYAEYPRIWSQAFDYSVDRTAYGTAYTNLNSILTPVLSDLTINTSVSGSTIRTRFSAYYDARTQLQNAITNKVNQIAADAQAKANKSAAITDKFATTINGGLISTVMMLLRELNSTVETAGVSGIQGQNRDNPALWSGGTYSQAMSLIQFLSKISSGTTPGTGEYNSLAKITMLHNGAAKIGDFIIEQSGRIVMVDPLTGKPRLAFGVQNLPLIGDLVNGVTSGSTTTVGAGNTTSSVMLSGSIVITKDLSSATFGATTLQIHGTGRITDSGMSSVATVVIYLLKDGVRSYRLSEKSILFSSTIDKDETAVYNAPGFSLGGLYKGTYTFELAIEVSGNVTYLNASSTSTNFTWSHSLQGVRQQQYGLDGMMFFYSGGHFYFNETGFLDGKAPADKWNAPGVLAAGSVSGDGVQTNVWGAKSSPAGAGAISGGRSVPLANMKHSNYVVQITPHTATTFRVGTKTTSSFQALGTGGFDYVVIGNNY